MKKIYVLSLFFVLAIFVSSCQKTNAPEVGYEIVEKTGESCETDDDCETPMEYLVRSICPYGSKCIENECAVICPEPFKHGEDIPSNTTEDIDKYFVTYENETVIYNITVTKPTPCHEVVFQEQIMESYPVQIRIDIQINDTGGVCAQVIEEETINGEIETGHVPMYLAVYVDGEEAYTTEFESTRPTDVHVCTEEEKEAEACTREYRPVCGDNGETYSNGCVACSSGEIDSYEAGACAQGPQTMCEDFGGMWIESANECEGISEEQCSEIGGEFNECASACRNDPDAEICTLQCVQVCEVY